MKYVFLLEQQRLFGYWRCM